MKTQKPFKLWLIDWGDEVTKEVGTQLYHVMRIATLLDPPIHLKYGHRLIAMQIHLM